MARAGVDLDALAVFEIFRHLHDQARFQRGRLGPLGGGIAFDRRIGLRDRQLDVLCLSETWHDSESVSIRRLRADGYAVIECARLRSRRAEASLSINHGGVAIVAVPGVRLVAVDVGVQPSTSEFVATRVVSGPSSVIVVVVYRPGSVAVTVSFFAEFTDLLDRLSTFADPLLLVGDVNVRFERASDPDTAELVDILASPFSNDAISMPSPGPSPRCETGACHG